MRLETFERVQSKLSSSVTVRVMHIRTRPVECGRENRNIIQDS